MNKPIKSRRWEIQSTCFNRQGQLLFEIVHEDRIQFVNETTLGLWVEERSVNDWIKRDTRGAVSTVAEYQTFLGRLGGADGGRIQLYFGDLSKSPLILYFI